MSLKESKMIKISIFAIKYYFINCKIKKNYTSRMLKADRFQSHDTGTGSGKSESNFCFFEDPAIEY